MVIRSKQKLCYLGAEPFNLVLVNPEIPPNTGNIARLCAATSSKLHLVYPLGFEVSDKHLKRAGLDYWHLLNVEEHKSWDDFCKKYCFQKAAAQKFWFISTRGEKNIWDVEFKPGDFFIFGSETKGLEEAILKENKDSVISIPMNGLTRSINLSTACGIALYEGLRQLAKEKNLIEIYPM